MAKKCILWIEDDYLDAIENGIKAKGYNLIREYFACDAEESLKKRENEIDLILLDVMIELHEKKDSEHGYNKENTNDGYETGLTFYKKNTDMINEKKIKVQVYSLIGDDDKIRNAFINLGLKKNNFIDKASNANINLLFNHIDRVLRS